MTIYGEPVIGAGGWGCGGSSVFLRSSGQGDPGNRVAGAKTTVFRTVGQAPDSH